MAGKKPSFITGATAKIKAYGKTIAYAQDVSYNTSVTTIPIETMGRYEVVSNEPVAYFVDGSLSIVRYTTQAKTNSMSGASAKGNQINNWDEKSGAAFDPQKLITSESFDLEIYQKTGNAATDQILVAKLRDCRMTRKGGGINKRGILVESMSFNAILMDHGSNNQNGDIVGNSGDTDLD